MHTLHTLAAALRGFPRDDYQPTRDAKPDGQGREWRVDLPGPDGSPRMVVFADNKLTGRGDTPHLVSVYVQDQKLDGAGSPLSQPRKAAGALGSAAGGLEPPAGYRRGPFDQQPQGQGAPASNDVATPPLRSKTEAVPLNPESPGRTVSGPAGDTAAGAFARVQQGQVPASIGPAAARSKTAAVFTGAGQRVEVKPEVVEHASLVASQTADGGVNPNYPADLQPRDRTAAASKMQVAAIAGGLEPQRMGIGADASVGAPIVGPDNVVESGNGRTAALGQVYANPDLASQAAAYRAYLESQGHDTSGIKEPVLIGRRVSDLTPEERRDFTLGANERSTLAMSAAERARADQARIGKALDLWRGGDVASAGNRDFVRAFMAQLSPEERGGMMLPDGGLAAEGERRIQSGLLAQAYGEALGPTLDRFLNSDAEGMKAIAGSLSDAAGVWGQMRAAAAAGEIPAGMDMTRDLAQAVQTVELARKQGLRVRDLALQIQATPRSANFRVAVICRLLSFAVDRQMRSDNPALRIPKLETGPGYRAWTAAELAAMITPAAGDIALPILIARYTSQREEDVLGLLWSAYDGATLTLRQGKGRRHNSRDQALVIPVPSDLRATLDTINPRPGILICLTASSRAWKVDWFRHRFAQVREAAGLPADLHYHGLRTTRLEELAEHGASDAEIQATSGHKTRSMVAHYTRGASQKRLAEAGVARLPQRNKNL